MNPNEVREMIESFNEEAVLCWLNEESLNRELFRKETAFFHIDNKLNFYIGNTGVPLKECGNLKNCTPEEIIEWIISSKDNYYETETVHYEDLQQAVREKRLVPSKENYVYPNAIAALLAMVQNGL